MEAVVGTSSPNAGLRFSASPTRPRLHVFAERGPDVETLGPTIRGKDEDTSEKEEKPLDLVAATPDPLHDLAADLLFPDVQDDGVESELVPDLKSLQEVDDTFEFVEEAERDVLSDMDEPSLLETLDEAEEDASYELDETSIEMRDPSSSDFIRTEAIPSTTILLSITNGMDGAHELAEPVYHDPESNANEPTLEEEELSFSSEAMRPSNLPSVISPLNLENAPAASKETDHGIEKPLYAEDCAVEESFLQEALSEEIARLEEEELQAFAVPLELEEEDVSDQEDLKIDPEVTSPLTEHVVKDELETSILLQSLSSEEEVTVPSSVAEIPAPFEVSEEESDYSDNEEEGEFAVGEVTMKVSGFGVFEDVEDTEDDAEEENDVTEMQGDADEATARLSGE